MLELYLPVVGVTVLAVTAYLAIVFMLAYAFKRPQLNAYAKIELEQLFISAIILVIAFAAWGFSSMVTEALAGGPPIEIALEYLDIVINEGILPIYMKLVRMEVLLTYFNAVEYRMGPGVWNWTVKATPGLDPLISITRMLIFSFTALYGTLSIQIIIFNLIDALMYFYLLPAGIVLRFFPPTRDAGIFLIVLAISFQCFFPMLYAINLNALTTMWQMHEWVGADDPYTPNIQDTNYFNSVNDALGTFTSKANEIGGTWALPIAQPFAFSLLVPFLDRVAQISLVGLVLPALCMTLTVAFVNAVTKFITGKG